MKKLLSIFIAALLATFLLIGCTDKAEAAPYVKLGIGTTDYNYNPASVGLFFDDSARAYSAAIGFQTSIAPWLSVEFEYLSMGDADGVIYGSPTEFKAKAYTAWFVGDWAAGSISGMPVELSVRAGFTRAKADAMVGINRYSDNDNGLAYGVGAKLWVSHATAITLDAIERDLTFNLGYGSFDYDPRIIMLGVQHNF